LSKVATVPYLERAIYQRSNGNRVNRCIYFCCGLTKLAQAQIIPYRSEYGGCKSWIDLAEPISIENAVPVLNDAAYTQLVAEIHGIVEKNCYASSV